MSPVNVIFTLDSTIKTSLEVRSWLDLGLVHVVATTEVSRTQAANDYNRFGLDREKATSARSFGKELSTKYSNLNDHDTCKHKAEPVRPTQAE